jgi:hypothetical protein
MGFTPIIINYCSAISPWRTIGSFNVGPTLVLTRWVFYMMLEIICLSESGGSSKGPAWCLERGALWKALNSKTLDGAKNEEQAAGSQRKRGRCRKVHQQGAPLGDPCVN